jgi:2-oxoglutarate dehydrogenase E1 component
LEGDTMENSNHPSADQDEDEPIAPQSSFADFGINAGVVEEILETYHVDPGSVDASWSSEFGPSRTGRRESNGALNNASTPQVARAATPVAPTPQGEPAAEPRAVVQESAPQADRSDEKFSEHHLIAADKNARVLRLVHAFRARGHRIANSDPLTGETKYFPELDPAHYGFGNQDLDDLFTVGDLPGGSVQRLRDILDRLRTTYCGSVGVEYTHVQDPGRKLWLQQQIERDENRPHIEPGQLKRTYEKLCAAEMLKQFLHTKFLGQKRFSLEGGEVVIPLLDYIIESAPRHGIVEYVLGMSHRGRLNVLANVMQKPLDVIFSEFNDSPLLDLPFGSGDVKYHKGFSLDRRVQTGERIHLTLTSNPSHLEAVNPVVEGRTKAKQVRMGDTAGKRIMPIILHGDAAFSGQGIVAETLNLSQLEGYSTGGTLHIIINNQIGFTTTPAEARSTLYCTDVAKMIQVPIFHVNADDPDAVLHCAELAMNYRERFGSDVVMDVIGYRRHGHNEGDEPAFTQPRLYAMIRSRPSVRLLYKDLLAERGDVSAEGVTQIENAVRAKLDRGLEDANVGAVDPAEPYEPQGPWTGFSRELPDDDIQTRVTVETLAQIAEGIASVPSYFRPHAKLTGLLDRRRKVVAERLPIDWAMGEVFAFGSLVLEGTRVRLSGQDSSRGTFSHRHAVLVDQDSGEEYTPLDHISEQQARFEVFDSLLSEAAVLGFEYGYSLAEPGTLTLWEAQFGDFANGAQVIIDQFIGCAHVKWGRMSGLVMLLPHGYEGQGPEHSSARIERYLQICAEDSIQVVNCTTPAQLFHVLRRQMRRTFRAPLVIFTPKSLLRSPEATSSIEDFTEARFQRVIEDAQAVDETDLVERVLICSGKVYYDLKAERKKRLEGSEGRVAILRLEQLYPWPDDILSETISQYKNALRVVWVQEEPANMGAWTFVRERIQGFLPESASLAYAGRSPSASTAVGSTRVHVAQQKELLEAAFEGLA